MIIALVPPLLQRRCCVCCCCTDNNASQPLSRSLSHSNSTLLSKLQPKATHQCGNMGFFGVVEHFLIILHWNEFPGRTARLLCCGNILIYEGRFTGSDPHAISLQPLGVGNATMPHIKAMDVPFHLIYTSLICAKSLQTVRKNKMGYL